ncbi:MAG: hypothetical protein CMH55_07155 [Myxococcales bacterium]|nr:hypothetical protein [Myxococcales bacterium]
MSRCGGDRICPEGTSCAESFNTCMPYCDDPQDCPPGSTCVNEIEGGFCVPSGARACGWEDACPPGTVCDPSENRCLEDRGACVERADCGDGGRCVEGRCLHEPSPCGPADSCPENQMCQDDLCIPGGDAMRSCRRDEDCPDREVCHILVAACVPHPDNYPCEGDHQCPRGFECIEGGCRPPGARVCSEVRPCLAGEVCDEVTRTCRPDVGQACADDDDCPVHQFCDGTGRMHICFDDPCEIDQDCRIGARCNERSGRCAEEDRPPCVRDEDCPIEGEICLPERQVCGLLHEVVPDSCEGDGDCPDDMYCDTDNQVCVNEGNAGIGEVCERDLDCDAGQRCLTYRGIERCMLLCNQDDDCNGPTRCDLHEGHRVCLPQEQ